MYFTCTQEEYLQEGVDVMHVGYKDNRPLLELLLTVSPHCCSATVTKQLLLSNTMVAMHWLMDVIVYLQW